MLACSASEDCMLGATNLKETDTVNRDDQNAHTLNWNDQSWKGSPNSGNMLRKFSEQIRRCAERLRRMDSELADRLESADRLAVEEVTVAFGGRFKSGKSLLVNGLIGRDLLPVNVEAETGAPCFIRRGGADSAFAVRGRQRRKID